ncbi:MAG: phosphotransferase [Sphingomonadales bacterium]|nr:phosphotransferase [Sphingomonadales bacterium]
MEPNSPLMEQAAHAALVVASANGLAVRSVTPIGGYANFMFKLEPFPIVARVAGSANSVRTGGDWLAREVQVADYLCGIGAPAIQPWRDFLPGPYEHQDRYLTFWEYFEPSRQTVSPRQLGSALSRLHEALKGYDAELPAMGALDEAWAILDRPDLQGRLASDDMALIVRTSEQVRNRLSGYDMWFRPLHGDAHHGNLWPTDAGLIWGDFEDAHLGPIEWDLACMTASSMVFGQGAAAEAARPVEAPPPGWVRMKPMVEVHAEATHVRPTDLETAMLSGWAEWVRTTRSIERLSMTAVHSRRHS